MLDYETDTLVGTLDYGKVRVATATMGFKHRDARAPTPILAGIAQPNFLLKIIPHVDGTARICELVRYHMLDVTLHGAWTGPASLELHPHALAPVAELPVLEGGVGPALHRRHDARRSARSSYDYLAYPQHRTFINLMSPITQRQGRIHHRLGQRHRQGNRARLRARRRARS